ncbi:IucA/IucC family protein [Mammaliicoccus sp. Dog046]|uniref:IucA/IucC family protein n=1 Tax=Mammaliicoccus sp. Dog046 TaxID=3034233 RepID=UPI002B25EB83|nr:IucA/IucC family protein [Mammaliicoccus sp. Dog046]WQK85633.1 IucA/IucC family protein [Mammaliicoccus sp. Dog046]
MNWTKDVYAHSEQFDRQYIQRCIQNSIDITFSKMMACLIEEQTHPIQNVVKRGDHFTLYVNEDTFIEYTHTYQRIYVNANAQHIEVLDPLHLIDWLNQYNQMQYDYQLLKVEIENHLINQALSFIHCSQMPKSDHPLLKSEQYVITGHNIHPCAKTKLGLTFNEVMQYAPEYNQAFKLNWLLVKQGFLYNNLETSEIQTLAKFSGYTGEIPEGYDLIPVHPYQFEHVIRNIYKDEIEQGDIIVLAHKGGLVKSTSSFRTVCPLDDMTPIIKLPVNAQMTSTIRSISNNSIINSKTIGDYFKYIYRTDERLNEISLPVLEYGGMTYIHDTEDKQRNLSFILRENNTQYLTTQSQLYAATCLFEFNEHHRKVYTDLIETASIHQSPIDWFEQYISILVETTLTLMTKYGIGLEAHLQNMSFEFINGTPQRLHVRDFGGLRIDDTRIPAWLDLSNALTRATTEGMYEKVQNTLISNHLNTLVRHFSADYKYDETLLWQKIKTTFDHVFEQLQQQNIQHTEADKHAFYTETINEKALLTMRVSTEKQDIYVQRHNPLLMNDDIKV